MVLEIGFHNCGKVSMARRSKLDPYKDQILEWQRQGKDTRAIQSKLKEINVDSSHVTISKKLNEWMAPTINRINQKAVRWLGSDEQAVDRILEILSRIDSFENMNFDQRNKFDQLGKWFD